MELKKENALDIVFPKFCVNCQTEGFYLCPDCFSLIEIFDRQYCPFCQTGLVVPDGKTCQKCKKSHKLNGLFCATSYENQIVRKLVHIFKYEPFVRDVAETLAYLTINHLAAVARGPYSLDIGDFILIPVPSHQKKLKYRGFNPAEEIAKFLSFYLKLPLEISVLAKIKQTPAQMELKKEERLENIKGAFEVENKEPIKNKKILLVDDVFTTGSTIEECASRLKTAGAKEVWGVVMARG